MAETMASRLVCYLELHWAASKVVLLAHTSEHCLEHHWADLLVALMVDL